MALETYSEYSLQRVAAGNIIQFGSFRLNYYYNMGSFGAVLVSPHSIAMPSATVHDGIMTLAGGRVYSPWSAANKRAPVSYARYAQQFMFRGDADACLRAYEDFLTLAGMTAALLFSHGRVTAGAMSDYTYSHFNGKQCSAMLLQVNAPMERDLQTRLSPLHRTHFIVTATWQQVGDFIPT